MIEYAQWNAVFISGSARKFLLGNLVLNSEYLSSRKTSRRERLTSTKTVKRLLKTDADQYLETKGFDSGSDSAPARVYPNE